MIWIVVLVWLGCAYFAASIAERKGLDRQRWLVMSLLLGVLAIPLAMITPAPELEPDDHERLPTRERWRQNARRRRG